MKKNIKVVGAVAGLVVAVGTWMHHDNKTQTVEYVVEPGDKFVSIAAQVAPKADWRDVAYHTAIIRRGQAVNISTAELLPGDELIMTVPAK